MKYGNELKIGIVAVVSIIIFIIGVRYFQDLPLLSGTYELNTSFENTDGLIPGNPVRINGVNVGAVEQVRLDPENRIARVRFHVDREIRVPEGSTTQIAGISALGSIHVTVNLGPPGNPAVEEGGFLPSLQADPFGDALNRAPSLIGRADSVLIGAGATFEEAQLLLQRDLRQTLGAIEGSARSLDVLLRTEQRRLAAALDGVSELTGNLNAVVDANDDSLAAAVSNLNQAVARLDRNLATLEMTSARLDSVLVKIDRGEGTLGLLVNDSALYYRLDTTLTSLNALMTDFQKNPRRYLKDLKLVDVF